MGTTSTRPIISYEKAETAISSTEFCEVTKDDFKKIATLMLDELKAALSDRSINFAYSDEAVLFIADASYSVKYGARNMRRYIQSNVEDKLAENGLFVKSIEGKQGSGWVLMDFGDIIVNLFTKEQRERYSIEKVWGDCEFIEVEE
mgnify:CR=1 FL=1